MKQIKLIIPFIFIIAGCNVQKNIEPVNVETPTVTIQSVVDQRTPTFTEILSTQSEEQINEVETICSPLEGIDLDELYAITSNSFSYPTPFTDTGHHGVDLAFFKFKGFETIHGHAVQAILPGTVVQVIDDRFPYGNMIMIETKLDSLSTDLREITTQPTPIPVENIDKFNTCSKDFEPVSIQNKSNSLYSLYSHLESKPDLNIGDSVACGQKIGEVGISGNSVADHLHVEFRIGPSEIKLGTLSSYKEDSTPEERYNYCIWSISGIFQAIDPSLFWSVQ